MEYKCEITLQLCLSAFSVHECEQRSAQEIGIDSAESTAGTSVAKLNCCWATDKNGELKPRIAPNLSTR